MAAKKPKRRAAATGRAAKGPAKKVAKKLAATKTAAKKPKLVKHEIVHWEIQALNPSRLHDFYGEALGWEIEVNNPMQYGMVASGGPTGINGGIGGGQGERSRVLVYAQVASIPNVLARIESLGGKTIMARTDIGPVVMGLYEDPEGNLMGLLEPR